MAREEDAPLLGCLGTFFGLAAFSQRLELGGRLRLKGHGQGHKQAVVIVGGKPVERKKTTTELLSEAVYSMTTKKKAVDEDREKSTLQRISDKLLTKLHKSSRHSVNVAKTRVRKFFQTLDGSFDEIQRQMKWEIYHQHIRHFTDLAHQTAQSEFDAIDQVPHTLYTLYTPLYPLYPLYLSSIRCEQICEGWEWRTRSVSGVGGCGTRSSERDGI